MRGGASRSRWSNRARLPDLVAVGSSGGPGAVERGHHDGVSIDPWVAYEYAKTRWLYAQFGMEEKTEIEFFNGGHTINGQGTFNFLYKQLNWPKK